MSMTVGTPTKALRVFPPPPRGFDALVATKRELAKHGLPQRPNPKTQPGQAKLWEQRARRYRDFDHITAELSPALTPLDPLAGGAAAALFPREQCGFELTSLGAPIVMLSGSWTVPNLNHTPTPINPVHFRTFFGLGFLDVHVEMTVDPAQTVTAALTIHTGERVSLGVRPGDVISAILCLQTNAAGTAAYFLANETTGQTTNFSMDTGFPPAVVINAGISRGRADAPFNPLAKFGVVYFDEIIGFSTAGNRFIVDGVATSMVDSGRTMAQPQVLTPNTFKIIHTAD